MAISTLLKQLGGHESCCRLSNSSTLVIASKHGFPITTLAGKVSRLPYFSFRDVLINIKVVKGP